MDIVTSLLGVSSLQCQLRHGMFLGKEPILSRRWQLPGTKGKGKLKESRRRVGYWGQQGPGMSTCLVLKLGQTFAIAIMALLGDKVGRLRDFPLSPGICQVQDNEILKSLSGCRCR